MRKQLYFQRLLMWELLAALLDAGKDAQVVQRLMLSGSCLWAPLLQPTSWGDPVARGHRQRHTKTICGRNGHSQLDPFDRRIGCELSGPGSTSCRCDMLLFVIFSPRLNFARRFKAGMVWRRGPGSHSLVQSMPLLPGGVLVGWACWSEVLLGSGEGVPWYVGGCSTRAYTHCSVYKDQCRRRKQKRWRCAIEQYLLLTLAWFCASAAKPRAYQCLKGPGGSYCDQLQWGCFRKSKVERTTDLVIIHLGRNGQISRYSRPIYLLYEQYSEYFFSILLWL